MLKVTFWVLFGLATLRGATADIWRQDLGAQAQDEIWQLVSSNGTIRESATVPGGVYTDLRNAGILTEEFYYRDNDHAYRWVGLDHWTYTRTFTLEPEWLNKGQVNLVFEGIDTVATVTLNGVILGTCDNMFVRYVFPVKDYLLTPDNALVVEFQSAVVHAEERSNETYVAPACVAPEFQGECHANQVRKMQASFSWDWGPAFPSTGVWKPVYLEAFDSVIIRDTVYVVNYLPGSNRWSVAATAHVEILDSGMSSGQLVLTLELGLEGGTTTSTSRNISLVGLAGPHSFNIVHSIDFNSVRQWWPNGMGEQPLYPATVRTATDSSNQHFKSVRLGYRTLSLVQQEVFPGQPNKGLSFYFAVNDVPMFSKGSNWIPAHVLPEVGSLPEYVDNLLHSSKEAGFNMLRIWGGGVYETDYFYEASAVHVTLK